MIEQAGQSIPLALIGCMVLAALGAAIQVAVGAGLSVVCGAPLFLWVGPAAGVPLLLCLNLLVSVLATAGSVTGVRWADVGRVSAAIVAGCGIAWVLPPLSEALLKALTAGVLVAVAMPRPRALDRPPSTFSDRAGLALAGLATGALTVWTATPGPIVPAALARSGRAGSDIGRTMQPISIVGYGAALVCVGANELRVGGSAPLAWLVGAVCLGTILGFRLRLFLTASRIVTLVRLVAGAAALVLVGSLMV